MARDLGFDPTDSEKYYFLSYNSDDDTRVAPLAMELYKAGIPLWYDKGIPYDEHWEEIISEKIHDSIAMIFFFTRGMLDKEKSYALKERRIADNQGKTIYTILIDDIEGLWDIYKRHGSLLDDLKQRHFPNDVFALIERLKKDNHIKASSPKTASLSNIPNNQIVDSEYLLSNGIFTSYEISKRHVDLDYLTVDSNLFPGAIEAEGNADTWEGMISQTADCTANLIVNNTIVGYMDFIPVTPENYIKLQTETFTDEYVAMYGFGGRFDIFVSMFSIDINYATQNNYALFINWMIKRILDWKQNDIHIGKIEFCIYSKYQAKALESLGFNLLLTNQLKGMLYEIKVEDLLNNPIVLNRFKDCRLPMYKYKQYDNSNVYIINQCLTIADSLSEENGGYLKYIDAVKDSDIIFAAEYNNQVIGYLSIKKYPVFENGLYIEQIAVKTNHQHLGVGSRLVKLAIKYARENGTNAIYANCKKINNESYGLFKKMGFIEFDMPKEQYLGIGIVEEDIKANIGLKITIK